ncbi:carboxypeptidase-like regulatory domain-containing protein [Actinomarinicola tropica]|uniref:alpha-amylase n=1 Tax=Actinomarinicola tropica TaxID=2789776 RepID=A0A5Q2RDQ7_9ACTN|nr:carboxypeptidase-like regulatory domain-containing protein [Actinomarinicola tropica]QGG95018.1 hypothetical protein GH723_07810 [Actinomarinicola tropica]
MTDRPDVPVDPADPDAELLAELGRTLDAHDPPSASAIAAARAAWTWRTIDAELAELRVDSALEPLGVRGMAWPRQLSFESRELTIEVEVEGDQLVGQLVPTRPLEVTLVRPDGTERTTRADPIGHFTFPDVPPGTLRLQVTAPDGAVTTQWFSV